MLQYSVSNNQSVLGDAANAFLLASLILGVAATANSALVVVWKNSTSYVRFALSFRDITLNSQKRFSCAIVAVVCCNLDKARSAYTSRTVFNGFQVPKNSTLYSLSLTPRDSAGVALFTLSTQHYAVIVIVLLLSLLAAISLVAMLFWFAWERVGDTHHRARMWWDKAVEVESHVAGTARGQVKEKAGRVGSWAGEAFTRVRRSLHRAIRSSGRDTSTSLPITGETTRGSSNMHIPLVSPATTAERAPRPVSTSGAPSLTVPPLASSSRPTASRSNSKTEPVRPKNRFADVGWKVANIIQSNSTSRSNRSRKDRESAQPVLLRSRMPSLVPALKRMKEQYVLDDHMATVRTCMCYGAVACDGDAELTRGATRRFGTLSSVRMEHGWRHAVGIGRAGSGRSPRWRACVGPPFSKIISVQL